MNTYLPLIHPFKNIENLFIGLFFLVVVFILLNSTLFINRYILNVTRPNVYLFEYESQLKRNFTLYNIINFFIRFLSYLLISFSFVYFINKTYFTESFSNFILINVVRILVAYFIIKIIIFQHMILVDGMRVIVIKSYWVLTNLKKLLVDRKRKATATLLA